MKRPPTRTKFASEADEREYTINCVCWLYAEHHYDGVRRAMMAAGEGPGGTLEELADIIKQFVKEGRLITDIRPDGDRFRLIPSAMNEAQGTA